MVADSPDSGDRGHAAALESLEALELLRGRREAYATLLAEIVADTCRDFPVRADGMVLEIGAGTGALRPCLPADLRERTTHTDPSEAALRVLRERAPQARTRVAGAEALPVEEGAAAAVVALCVFDAVADRGTVVREVARVLRPGDRFFHFLDMATLLEEPFAKLAAGGLVPLPNVFGDPADSEWPLDIVLVARDWLTGLLRWATTAAHPLSAAFSGYFGAFLHAPFDVARATSIFKAVASNGDSRRTLVTLLESAGRAAFRAGLPAIEPLPFHSGRYLQSILETAFGDGGPFHVERSAIVTRAAWAKGGARRYRSLCLGHQRLQDDFPSRFLTADAATRVASGGILDDETLTELGVYVFVAVRK